MRTLTVTLTAAAVLVASLAPAQGNPAEAAPPAAQKPVVSPPEVIPPASAGSDGFSLQSENGEFQLRLRAYVQFDGRFFPDDPAQFGIDTFVMRRVRPILDGSVGEYFKFRFMPDFGGSTPTLQDAWLDFVPSAKLGVRVGKDKAPVGLERLQSATALSFVERAFPTLIVPNRDIGIQLHGNLAGGVVAYAAGVFDGAPDGGSVDRDLEDGKDFAGRIMLSPFKKKDSALKQLGIGIAGTTGNQSGPLPAYRSSGQISIITILDGITADGRRNRYSPQLSFYSGPFGLMAEYAYSESWVLLPDTSRVQLKGSAWQTTVTYCITGDKASYAGVRPRKPFDPENGQWGAIELAARVHGLELSSESIDAGIVDPDESVREVFAWAVGINWSLTNNVKQVFDFERATFTGGAASGQDRDPEIAVFIRTQVSF